MKMLFNDKILGKVIKTFIEGFIASFIVSLQNIENFQSIDLFKNVLIGALAMGISAVLNLLQLYLNKETK